MTGVETEKGERIAKRLARAGICSRRDAERMIAAGRVMLNGMTLETPAINVFDRDKILVDGSPVGEKAPTQLWLYHKPCGLVTSHNDEKGRDTIFDHLPKDMPRVISVGRLDLNSEGLLLLTNDGELSRHLELPATGIVRKYRVRAYGKVDQDALENLKNGIMIEGISYGAMIVDLEPVQAANVWMTISLQEGKNREIRRVLDFLGLTVNRLIRTSYGAFELGNLPVGAVCEVSTGEIENIFTARV